MKIVKWLNKNFEESILIVLLMVMTVIMGSQVVARYIFNYSISWSEELTRYLFVWSGFLSISFAVEKALAIRIDMLVNILNMKTRKIFFILDYIIELVLFTYLVPTACSAMVKVFVNGRTSTAMGMPMWILQTAPAVGFILADLRVIQKIYRMLTRREEDKECTQ